MNDLRQQLLTVAPKMHPFSDVDIAIYIESTERYTDLNLELSFSLKLDELLNCKHSTEIRIINNLPLTVVGEILKYSHLIYSRDEAKRVQYETRSRLAYFDFLHAIRYHQSI